MESGKWGCIMSGSHTARLLMCLVAVGFPAWAQAENASVSAESSSAAVEAASLAMPDLAFTATLADIADYDKFFYFHRPDTSFAEAHADIKECDALSSGISYYRDTSGAVAGATAQYGVAAGAIGGAIAGLLVDAIFGSAERRRLTKINLRNCMGFKDYRRYGLSQDLWKKFNFEEGMGRKREGEREEALQLQAMVASGPAPASKELGL